MVGELAIYMLSIAKLRTQICNRHVSDNSTRKHVSDFISAFNPKAKHASRFSQSELVNKASVVDVGTRASRLSYHS